MFHEIAIMKISDVQEFALTLGEKSLKNICGVNLSTVAEHKPATSLAN